MLIQYMIWKNAIDRLIASGFPSLYRFCEVMETSTGLHADAVRGQQMRLMGILVPALFYVAHNVGTMLFQARGVPQEQGGAAVAGYFLGIVAGAFGLTFLERRREWSDPGRRGAFLRGAFLAVMLFPAVFCQISFQLAGYAGTPFLNAFQPFLWSLSLPVALRFFFAHVRPGRQALFFGLAIGIGHLCWALLTPLAGVGGLEERHLLFLNTTRSIAGVAMAVLCWQLSGMSASSGVPQRGEGKPDEALGSGKGDTEYDPGRKPIPASYGGGTSKWYWLLLPFLACFFLNGFMGYLFFPRLLGRGLYPEYMHLALAVLFPIAGLCVMRWGNAAFISMICVSALSFAVFPLLLFLPEANRASGWTSQAAYLVCAAAQQVLLFCGALVFTRFAVRSPVLGACTVWLAASIAIPGRLMASSLLPALSLPVFPVACVLCFLCAASLAALRMAFPLPPLSEEKTLASVPAVGADADAPTVADRTKQSAFVVAFDLTRRESELLEALIGNQDMEEWRAARGVSPHTVKFHIRGLLKKTSMSNRQRLMHFYAAWQPEQ